MHVHFKDEYSGRLFPAEFLLKRKQNKTTTSLNGNYTVVHVPNGMAYRHEKCGHTSMLLFQGGGGEPKCKGMCTV